MLTMHVQTAEHLCGSVRPGGMILGQVPSIQARLVQVDWACIWGLTLVMHEPEFWLGLKVFECMGSGF